MKVAVALLAGAAFAFLSTRFAVGDSDVYWHLVTARETLARGIGHADALSWTAAGRAVATDQWLGQLGLWGAYALDGWRGIVALRGLAAGALAGLVVLAALDARPRRPLLALLAALPALFLSRFVTAERPELLGFVCFALFVVLVRRGRAGDDWLLLAVAPLIALWANVHGSFALGVALTILMCAEGALAEPARRRVYLITAVAAAAASLATPSGLAAWTAPGLHFTTPPREIQEWAVPDVRSFPGAIFGLTLAAVLGVAMLRVPSARPWADAMLLVPLLFLALTAQRQMPYFAMAAAPFLAARLPLADAAAGRARGVLPPALVAAALVLLVAGIGTGPREPETGGYPAGALAALRPGPGLFNQYDWGGYLVLHAPETPVFVDGRLVPYLGAVLDDYRVVIAARPGWRDVVTRRGIRQLLVRPADPVAVRARELGWRVAASGGSFVLIDVP